MQTSFNTSNTSNLPDEIWLKIFEYTTSPKILANISLVCKHWFNLSQDRALLSISLKQKITRMDSSDKFFVKDSIKIPGFTIKLFEESGKFLKNPRQFLDFSLTNGTLYKKIYFFSSLVQVRSIQMIGDSHLGVFTTRGFQIYDSTNKADDDDVCCEKSKTNSPYVSVPATTSRNGLAYFHCDDGKIYIYREENGKLGIKNHPVGWNALRGFALQENYLATVVITVAPKEKQRFVKKIGQAAKDRLFKNKKVPEEPVFLTKMMIYPLNGKGSHSEILLQQTQSPSRPLVADQSCFAVQNNDEEVLVVNPKLSTTHTIPHKSKTFNQGNRFFLKDGYLVTVSYQEKTASTQKKIIVEAWFGKTRRSSIELKSLKEIDTWMNIAAILLNDHEIAFYNLNSGKQLDKVDFSSIFNDETKKESIFCEVIESIQFNTVGQLKIKTSKPNDYYMDF